MDPEMERQLAFGGGPVRRLLAYVKRAIDGLDALHLKAWVRTLSADERRYYEQLWGHSPVEIIE